MKDFSFDLIPFDTDLMSLEMNNSFRDLYLNNDLLVYNYVADSINRLQCVYGRIPNVFAVGNEAEVNFLFFGKDF